ncbi:MAG: pyrroloquinoline quinone biosynthesis peptide chaperone PqqD [Bryobacteraceae bacterium]
MDSVPRLAPGCRLSTAEGQEDVLLMPERALRLKGPARSIVELCDGARTLREIIEVVKQRYSSGDPKQIETDVVSLLAGMRDRGVIEYV